MFIIVARKVMFPLIDRSKEESEVMYIQLQFSLSYQY